MSSMLIVQNKNKKNPTGDIDYGSGSIMIKEIKQQPINFPIFERKKREKGVSYMLFYIII